MSQLTVVMYHYIRALEGSRHPEIKALRVNDFRDQLGFLRRAYNPVGIQDVVGAIRAGEPLPERAVLLTFDDGYIDHYTNVFPLLRAAGIQGAFFPSVATAVRGELLDVNRIHFILACVPEKHALVRTIEEFVDTHSVAHELRSKAEYRHQYAHPNRYDPPEVNYIKRMLQTGLPDALRRELTARLFATFVSSDERAFSAELYASKEQLAEMAANGMYIGAHGDSHAWLDSLDRAAQMSEIDQSLALLREIGSPVDDFWAIAYPFGGWNEPLLSVIRERHGTIGFTTQPTIADLDRDAPLLIPRFDTNDLPRR
jgi:peptidoglycan/xylan/chitin deacetylase (PgdA/CDA1 family)